MPARTIDLRAVRLCALVLGVSCIAAAPFARAADESAAETWEMLLSAQIKAEKRCDIEATYYIREMPTPEGTTYSGRVRCIDGREFDFEQPKPHLKFEIRACEPAAC